MWNTVQTFLVPRQCMTFSLKFGTYINDPKHTKNIIIHFKLSGNGSICVSCQSNQLSK